VKGEEGRSQEAGGRVHSVFCLLSSVFCLLLRSIGTSHLNVSLTLVGKHTNQPGVATHFAVLNEIALDVGLEVELDFFAAVRTRNKVRIAHGLNLTWTSTARAIGAPLIRGGSERQRWMASIAARVR
jgi:hypothetical protein